MSRLTPIQTVWLHVSEFAVQWRELLAKDQSPAFDAQLNKLVDANCGAPDIIIGAGHTTHKAILAIKKHKKCFAVVLMRPSLPYRLFDAAVVPRHDTPPSRQNIFTTEGVLNAVYANVSIPRNPHTGLLLIGGESKHFHWDSQKIIEQVAELLSRTNIHWQLSDSRRTPDNFLVDLSRHLRLLNLANKITIFSHKQTSPQWLPDQLQTAAQCWVTPDSVSMVYESLTASCPTGVFELSKRKKGKIVKSLDALVLEEKITRWKDWQSTGTLSHSEEPFCEAERAAHWLLEKFTSARQTKSHPNTP